MKVYISRVIPSVGLEILQKAGITVTQYQGSVNLPAEYLQEEVSKHDALLSIGPDKINEAFLDACPGLQAIALMSAGYDKVDVAAVTKRGIPVSNTPDVLSAATADIAFLLMLNVSRNVFFMHRSIEKGSWGFFDPNANLGVELYGKTLGIFGLGKIGLEMALKAKAVYGMQIIYHNRSRNAHADDILNARYVTFEELLQQSDVLSVHASLSESTNGIFNKKAFTQMKPTAIFINTSRGQLHNEEDLRLVLEEGIIWGAGLDVTNPEPMLPSNPLQYMSRVCVLPHIGSATKETRDKMAIVAANNIVAALQGKRMPQVINPAVYG